MSLREEFAIAGAVGLGRRRLSAAARLVHQCYSCCAAIQETAMQRVTITIDDELDAELDRFMKARGYANRSEAIRDLARSGLQQAATEIGGTRACVAALVYLYDHEARELPKRLTRDFHDRHDLAQATLHVHLDHESCMEVTVLKGRGSDVQELADHIIAERGVRHGHVVYLPAQGTHAHGRGESHSHSHSHPHKSRKA